MESILVQITDHHLFLMFRLIALFLTTLLMAAPALACHCTVHGGESSASESSEQKSEEEQEQD